MYSVVTFCLRNFVIRYRFKENSKQKTPQTGARIHFHSDFKIKYQPSPTENLYDLS